MSNDDKEIAESVRSGAYFEQSRAWFDTIYFSIISERTFYLMMAVSTTFIGIICLISVLSLLPIVTRPALLIPGGDRIDEIIPKLIPLRSPGASVEPAVMRFFISQYVKSREGYSYSTYSSNAMFVQAQSNDAVYQAFTEYYSSANPQGPAALLGENGERKVVVRGISVRKEGEIWIAKVNFVTEDVGIETESNSQWTADIKFQYTPLTMEEGIDPETGKKALHVVDPQFKVVEYVLTKK